MKKLINSILVSSLFFIKIFANNEPQQDLSIQAQSPVPLIGMEKTSLDMQQFENFVARAMATYHVPGTSVALIKDGKIAYVKGFGYRDIENQLPATPETIFAIGSCTKAFTATALGKLVDQGMLDWDTPIKTYLPGFEMYDKETTKLINVRDCLCHRSGLPAYGGDECSWDSFENKSELAAHLRNVKPNAKFREKWQYSNTIYALAGYILETISDIPWDIFLQRYILEPYGLHNTYLFSSSVPIAANASLAYEFDRVSYAFKPVDYNKPLCRWVAPAGSIHSNVLDMAQWVIMNLQNKSKEINTEVHKPQISIDKGTHYCFGWIRMPDGMMWHNGGTTGCSALVGFSPKEQTGIVILSNIQNADEFTNLLVGYMKTYLTNDQAWFGKRWYKKIYGKIVRYACEVYVAKTEAKNVQHKVISVNPAIFDKYLGSYKLSDTFIFTITKDSDKLFAQATNQEKYQIFPESEKKFFYATVNAQISFVENKDGQVTQLILHQNGKNQVAEKKLEPLSPCVES